MIMTQPTMILNSGYAKIVLDYQSKNFIIHICSKIPHDHDTLQTKNFSLDTSTNTK